MRPDRGHHDHRGGTGQSASQALKNRSCGLQAVFFLEKLGERLEGIQPSTYLHGVDWFVYLVRCRDGTQYAGIAKDLKRRLEEHNAGKGARYTRGRAPVELLASAGPFTQGEALSHEYALKQKATQRKLAYLLKL